MTETTAFFADFTSSSSLPRSICPTESTGSSTTSNPCALRRRQGCNTAGCSTAVVMIFVPSPRASTAPRIAVLSDSVAHEVNTISSGLQLTNLATSSRARATIFATCPPNACIELGFPYSSQRKGVMTSLTSGATIVVALLSRYVVFCLLSMTEYYTTTKHCCHGFRASSIFV